MEPGHFRNHEAIVVLGKASPAAFAPSVCPGGTNEQSSRVALIDTRTLLGEILLERLRTADLSTEYALYPSASAWIATNDHENNDLVLLSADAQPGRTPEQCASDLQLLKRLRPKIRVIIISSEENPEAVSAALEIGAEGYISTSLQVQVAVQVIHLVKAGGRFVPAVSFQALAKRSVKVAEEKPARDSILSSREILVAKALRKGTPNKLIAYELNMCESTVKVHVRHIMKKLNAKNRTQVAFLTTSMFRDDYPSTGDLERPGSFRNRGSG